MAKKQNRLSNGMGKLNSDVRGGLSDMRSPLSRAPLKGDVVPFDPTPAPKTRDPLDYFPKGTYDK